MEALRQELEAAQAKLAKAEASRAKLRSHVAVLKVHAKNALTLIDEHRKLQEAHAELANELQQAQEQLQEQADLEQQLQQALQDKAAEAAKARKAEQQLQHQAEELAQLKALHQAEGLELQRLRHEVAAPRQQQQHDAAPAPATASHWQHQQPAAPAAAGVPEQLGGVDPSGSQAPASAALVGPPATVQQQVQQGTVLGMPSMLPPGAPASEVGLHIQQMESIVAQLKAAYACQAVGTQGGYPAPGNPAGGLVGAGATDRSQQQQQEQDANRQSPDPSPAQLRQHSTDADHQQHQQQRRRQQMVAPAATSRAGSIVDGPGHPRDPHAPAVVAGVGLQLPGEVRAGSGSPSAHQAGAGGALGGGSSGGAAVTPLGGWGSCSTDSPGGEPATTGPAAAGIQGTGRCSSCAVPAAGRAGAGAGAGDAGGGLGPQDSDGVDWGLGRCPSVAPSSAGDFPGHASRSSTLPGLFDSTDSDSEGCQGTDRASRGRPIPRKLPAEMIAAAAAAGAMAAAAAGRNTAAAARSRSQAGKDGRTRAAGGTSSPQQPQASRRQQAAAALELAFGSPPPQQQETDGEVAAGPVQDQEQQEARGHRKQQRSSGSGHNSGTTTGSRGSGDRSLLKKNQKRYQKLIAVTKAKELATQPLEVKSVPPAMPTSSSCAVAADGRSTASPSQRRKQQQDAHTVQGGKAAAARVAPAAQPCHKQQQGQPPLPNTSKTAAAAVVTARTQPQQYRSTGQQPGADTNSTAGAPLRPSQKAAALLAASGFSSGRKRGAPAPGRGPPGKVPRTGVATTPAAAAAAAAAAGPQPTPAGAAAKVPSGAAAAAAGPAVTHPPAVAGQQQVVSAARTGPIPGALPPPAVLAARPQGAPAASAPTVAPLGRGESQDLPRLSASHTPALGATCSMPAASEARLDQHVSSPVPVSAGHMPVAGPTPVPRWVPRAPGGACGALHLPPALQLPPANIRALLKTPPPPGRKGWAYRLLQQRDAAAAAAAAAGVGVGVQPAPPVQPKVKEAATAAAAATATACQQPKQQDGPGTHAALSLAAQQTTAAAGGPMDASWVRQQLQRLWSPGPSPAAVTAVSQQLAGALTGEHLKLDDFLLGCKAAVGAMAAADPSVGSTTPALPQQLHGHILAPVAATSAAGSKPALLAQCVAQVGQQVNRRSAMDQDQSAAAAAPQGMTAAVAGAAALPHSVCGVLMLGVLAAIQPWAPLAQHCQPDNHDLKQQQAQPGQAQEALTPALTLAAAAAGGAGQCMDLHMAAAACATVAHMQLVLGGGVAAVLQLVADLLMAAGSPQPASPAAGGGRESVRPLRDAQQQQQQQQQHVGRLPVLPLVAAVVSIQPGGWTAAVQDPGSTQVPQLAAAVKALLLNTCLAAQQRTQVVGAEQQEAAAQQAAAEWLLQLGRQHWGWPSADGHSSTTVEARVQQHVAAVRGLLAQLQQQQQQVVANTSLGGQVSPGGGQDVAAAVMLHASQLPPAVVQVQVVPAVREYLEEVRAAGARGAAKMAAAAELLASLEALARHASG